MSELHRGLPVNKKVANSEALIQENTQLTTAK
jgi:hypothetical protein